MYHPCHFPPGICCGQALSTQDSGTQSNMAAQTTPCPWEASGRTEERSSGTTGQGPTEHCNAKMGQLARCPRGSLSVVGVQGQREEKSFIKEVTFAPGL